GLLSRFLYDTNGNVISNIVSGADLTGEGASGPTNATSRFIYTNLNLLARSIDPVGNETRFQYGDSKYPYLRTSVERYASNGTSISTNFSIYTNTVTVVTNGPLKFTNQALGILWRSIRAYGTSDAGTNEFASDGRGLLTSQTQYTRTSDPDVTYQLVHNA